MWRRHQLIITTLSPLAKRFNQCHRANFRSPLVPVPSLRSVLPCLSLSLLFSPPPLPSTATASSLLLSRAPIRAAPLQEITWYTIETQAEVAIYQFPGWTRRRRSRFRFSSPLAPSSPFTSRGPALMTLENRSPRSLAHCHSSLSHAPLIARYLSLLVPFSPQPGVFDSRSTREVSGRFYLLS